jgi:hypothetical protein
MVRGLIFSGILLVVCTVATVTYRQGNDTAAATIREGLFKLFPFSPGIAFNSGVTLYRRRDYRRAAAEFFRAARSKEPALSAAARYNLGNALLRQGDALPPGERQGAVEFYRQAIVRYEEAARLNGADQDVRINLAVARGRLRSAQGSLPGAKPAPGGERREERGAGGKDTRERTPREKREPSTMTDPAAGDQHQPGGRSSAEGAGEGEKGNNSRKPPSISRRDAEALIRAQRQPGGSTALFRDGHKPGNSAAVLKEFGTSRN